MALSHPHARRCPGDRLQHIDAGHGFVIAMAGRQHHAFADAEFHLARCQVGDQDGVLADQVFRLVGAGYAAEDVARFAFAHIQRQTEQFD